MSTKAFDCIGLTLVGLQHSDSIDSELNTHRCFEEAMDGRTPTGERPFLKRSVIFRASAMRESLVRLVS